MPTKDLADVPNIEVIYLIGRVLQAICIHIYLTRTACGPGVIS